MIQTDNEYREIANAFGTLQGALSRISLIDCYATMNVIPHLLSSTRVLLCQTICISPSKREQEGVSLRRTNLLNQCGVPPLSLSDVR